MSPRRAPRRGRVAAAAATHSDRLADAAVVLLALKLLVVILAMDPRGADPFALPKAMASRAFLYVTVPLGLVAILAGGIRPRLGPVWWSAGALVGVAVLATFFAVDQTVSLFGAQRRLLGLTSIVDGATTATLIALLVTTYRRALVLAAGAALGIVVNLAYGAVQAAGRDPLRWIDPVVGGTLGNSTSFAALLAIGFGGTAGALLLLWPRLSPRARLALAAVSVAQVSLVALSGARAPALAIPAAATAALAVATRSGAVEHLRSWRTWLGLAGLGAVTLLAMALGPAGARLMALVTGDTSILERQLIYGISFNAFLARPLLGVGPDGLIALYQSLRPPEAAQMTDVIAAGITSTHGWLLSHLVGSGVGGGAAALALLAAALTAAWSGAGRAGGELRALCFAPLVAFAVQSLFTIGSVAVDLVFWTLIGATAAAIGTEPQRRILAPRLLWAIAGAAGAIGLLAASTVLSALEADRALLVSNAARQRGNAAVAAAAAADATRLDPRRADHWNVLGLAHSRRDTPAAIRAFERASQLAPYDAVYLLNLAAEEALYAQRDASHRDRALRHAREAVDRDPNWPPTLKRASEVLAFFGRVDEARVLADRAIALRPPTPDFYDWAAQMREATGDPDGALRLLDEVRRLNWPGGAAPSRDFIVRTARLHVAAGRADEARRIVGAPQLHAAVLCATERCFIVEYLSTADLVTGDAPGAIDRAATYTLDGRPLPAGTAITLLVGGRRVMVEPPGGVRAGMALGINAARDVFGSPLSVPRATISRADEVIAYDAAVLLDEAEAIARSADASRRQATAGSIASAVARYPDAVPLLRRASEIALLADLRPEAIRLADQVATLRPTGVTDLEWVADIYARAGDHSGALTALERALRVAYPSGELPPTARVRFALALRAAGSPDRARELVPPPRATGAAACNGPCFFVYFDSVADMVTGDAPGSVARRDAYEVDGRPLPAQARIAVQYGGRVVAIEGPAVFRPGQVLRIRDVRSVFGDRVDAELTMRQY